MINDLVPTGRGTTLPLPNLFTPDVETSKRFIEFFTANIRNPNTRKAYVRAVARGSPPGGTTTGSAICRILSRCTWLHMSRACRPGLRPLP